MINLFQDNSDVYSLRNSENWECKHSLLWDWNCEISNMENLGTTRIFFYKQHFYKQH